MTATYPFPKRALEKWRRERLKLHYLEGGRVDAIFLLEGSTCSNMGRAFNFEYRVSLDSDLPGATIIDMQCEPAASDEGHKAMCSYLESPDRILGAVAGEKPFLGRSLDDILQWGLRTSPAGCLCAVSSRNHKWQIVLCTLHYSLSTTNATPVIV